MTSLPENVKLYFFNTIEGSIPIESFEQWLYENNKLESLLKPDDYLELVSLNYKKSGARYDLCNLLEKLINLGEYETYKLLKLLNRAKEKDEDLAEILVQFYKLYCKGYYFLSNLGIQYGLAIEIEGKEFWSAGMLQEHEELLKSFSPELDTQLQMIIDSITVGTIIITGEKNELGRFEYQDFRTDDERKLTEVEVITLQPKKKWWHIW